MWDLDWTSRKSRKFKQIIVGIVLLSGVGWMGLIWEGFPKIDDFSDWYISIFIGDSFCEYSITMDKFELLVWFIGLCMGSYYS